MPELRELFLANNEFLGELPESLGNSKQLTILYALTTCLLVSLDPH